MTRRGLPVRSLRSQNLLPALDFKGQIVPAHKKHFLFTGRSVRLCHSGVQSPTSPGSCEAPGGADATEATVVPG